MARSMFLSSLGLLLIWGLGAEAFGPQGLGLSSCAAKRLRGLAAKGLSSCGSLPPPSAVQPTIRGFRARRLSVEGLKMSPEQDTKPEQGASADESGGLGVTVTDGFSVLNIAQFAIESMFSSKYYIGGEDFHFALPLTPADQTPEWIPQPLRVPESVYTYFTEKGVKEGWVKEVEGNPRFRIKYGVFRAIVPDEEVKCDACEEAKRTELRNQAAEELVNIGQVERDRRLRAGYQMGAIGVALAAVSVAGFWDVDGSGMKRIEDPQVAQALRDKVNSFNKGSAVKALPYQLVFVFFPFRTFFDAISNFLN